MSARKQWIYQKAVDDVATVIAPLEKDMVIKDESGAFEVTLLTDIPFGHKFAVRDLPKGTHVRKYGQVIGAATEDIRAGEWVHAHNLESLRGRGDLAKEQA